MSSDEADTRTEKMKETETKNVDSQSGNERDTEPVKVNNKANKKKNAAPPKIKPPAKKRVKAEQAEKEAEKDAMEEEKKKDKKKVEESEEENEEEEEDDNEDKTNGIKKGVPLLDQPLEIAGSRERKQVQRFNVVKKENEETKAIVIPEGSGTELGEIPRIEHNLQRYKVETLKNLHKVCFNRTGKAPVIKKNIRKFNGFGFDKDSTDYEKKKAMISKFNVNDLKTVAMILDLGKFKKKDDVVELILNFLLKPVDSGKPVPEGRSKRKGATLKTYDEYDSDHKVNSDQKKKRVVRTKAKKKNVKEESESNSELDEKSEKKENDDKNDVSKSESGSDVDDDEDEPKIKKTKKALAKTKEKKTSAPPKKRAAAKRAALAKKKKADESDDGEAEEEDNAESGGESDEGDDEPLLKKSKNPPTEDEIKAYVKSILEGANLEEITMKTVCKQVYSHYPEFDLGHKKDFIKTTVKSLISS